MEVGNEVMGSIEATLPIIMTMTLFPMKISLTLCFSAINHSAEECELIHNSNSSVDKVVEMGKKKMLEQFSGSFCQ